MNNNSPSQTKRKLSLRLLVSLCSAAIANSQIPAGNPAVSPAAPEHVVTRVGTNLVSFSVTGGERLIDANGLPDHAPGAFPNAGNPNRIAAQTYHFHLPLQPQLAAQPRSARGAWFGVALNGVPFEPGTAEFWQGQREWNYEAKSGFINLGLDTNNAHVQPTGAYHYHGLPTGLMLRLGGDARRMLLVGYAADGFPIYTSRGYAVANDSASPLKTLTSSYRIRSGERAGGPGGNYDGRFTSDYEYVAHSGDLDDFNGRFGVTPEFPGGTYYYCLTEEFPQMARSWRGTPDASFMKRGPGPGGFRPPRGPNDPNRRPPQGPPPGAPGISQDFSPQPPANPPGATGR